MQNGAQLQNAGTFNDNSYDSGCGYGVGGSNYTIYSTGGATPSVSNTGTFTAAAGNGGVLVIDVPFSNQGTVAVTSGTLRLADGGIPEQVAAGVWSTRSGAHIALTAGTFLIGEATSLSDVEVSGATVEREPVSGPPHGYLYALPYASHTVTVAGYGSSVGSGFSSATIEVAPLAGEEWTPLCTNLTPSLAGEFSCAWNTPSGSYPDGTYKLRALLTDSESSPASAPTPAIAIVVDNTPPTGTVEVPAYLHGTEALVSGTAEDSGSGVASWQLQISPAGKAEWTNACPAQTAPHSEATYRCSVNTTGDPGRSYEARAIITDNAGNQYTTAAAGTTIDNTPPTGTLTRVTETEYARGTLKLSGTASAPLVGIASWTPQIQPAGGTWTNACAAQTSPLSGSTYGCELNTAALANGEYTMRAQVQDNAGNIYDTSTQSFTIDNTPPTGSLSTLPRYVEGLTEVKGSAHDALSGIATWQLEIEVTGSNSWHHACMEQTMPSEEATYSCSIDTALFTNGSYQLHAVITDHAGNTYTTKPISTHIQNGSASEEPEAACTDTWTGGAGTWQTASNWSTHAVPTAHDSACIPAGATVNVTSGTDEAASLDSSGELVISGGTLNLTDETTVSEAASLTQSGGTITGPGVFEISGSLSWTRGTMEGSGATILLRTAISTINSVTLANRELINEGALTLEREIASGWDSPGVLVNTGTLQNAEGAEPADIGTKFANEGTVTADSGSMELTGGGVATSHAGTWSAGSGATIVFNEGEYHLGTSATFDGAIDLTSGAHVSAQQIHGTSAQVSIAPNGSYSAYPTVLDVEGPAPSTIATLNVDGARGWEIINTAVLTGAGEVDVTRSFTGGPFAYLEGTGTTVIEPGASAAVSSSLGLEEQHKLENAGTLTMSEGAYIGGPRDGTLINTGTLDKPEGAGTATIASPFKNEGVVNVSSGTLELTGGGTSAEPHSSTWSASEGAKLAFNSREAFALGSSVDLAGTVEISEGPVTAETIDGATAAVTINGYDWSNRGTLEVNGATPSTLGTLTVNGGRVDGSGTVAVTNAFAGANNADLSGVGTLELQPGANGTISGTVYLEERTLDNAGTLTIGADDTIEGSHTRVLNSGTLNVNGESPAGDEHGLVADGGGATVVNTGVVAKTEGSWPALIGFAIDNDGTIDADSGTLEFTGGGESAEFASDTWTAAPGAAIELNGISSGATYSLGAAATINGSMHLDDNVTVGTIKGSGASLTTLHSILTLTGLTPSELGSLTFLAAPPDYWFPQIQHVSVASELDIDNSLTWSSSNAVFEGPGAMITEPGSTTVFDAGSARFDGGQFINEGTATWETGQLADEVDVGTFFINYGTFHADAQGFEPLMRGCVRVSGGGHQCPVFENDGIFTAELPHRAEGDSPVWPHIAWDVDIKNYGELTVPYRQEYVCPGLPPYGWTSEQCVAEQQVIRETYAGLLLKEGAEVIEPAWNVSSPVIEGFAEEGETLRATTGSWRVPRITAFAYQWQRCVAEEEFTSEEEWLTEPPPQDCSNVSGATGSTYAVTSEDAGYRLRVVVSAHTRVRSEAADSEATNAVAPYGLFGEEAGEEEAAEASEAEEGEGITAEESFIPEEAHSDASVLAIPAFSPGAFNPEALGGPVEPVGYIHYTRASPRYRKIALSSVDNRPLGEWRNEAKFTPTITPAELSWLFVLSPGVQAEAIGPVTELATTYKMPSKKPFKYGSDFHPTVPADYHFHSRIHVYLGQEYQLEIKFSYLCLIDGEEGDCLQVAKQNFKVDS
ncbi:MAG: Ig-like domain repeat protein [Acidimicrobiales bacterium]